MPVRFILGRSGSGKTHYGLHRLASALRESADGPPLILLAPEQATFQLERLLIETPDLPGYHRARVLSFRRFAALLFNELGGPGKPIISPLAKQMALRAVLGPMRAHLPTFAACLDRPGFLARLADTFGEFHQYQITADQLRQRAQREPRPPLRQKLIELADAFDAFNAYLARACFADPDALLTLAAERLSRSRLARSARVWVDGFAGFTPQELHFLGELAASADRMEVALLLDPDDLPQPPAPAEPLGPFDIPPGRLFRRTEQTYLKLARLFAAKGVRTEPPLKLQAVRRFSTAPRLAELEGSLFDRQAATAAGAARQADALAGWPTAALLDQRDAELVVVEAPNRRAEVRAAANHILRLAARSGYRWRDIAVIVRSLDEYWPFVVEAFQDASIPFFIDRRQPLSHHPLVELVRSTVATVAGGLNARDVIAWLKTDLPAAGLLDGDDLAASRDTIDRLENYALQFGLAGRAWLSPGEWRYHESACFGEEDLAGPPAEPEAIDRMVRVATACLGPLAELHESVSSAGRPTVRQWTGWLWRLLARLNVPRTLAGWPDDAEVHGQVFEQVRQLLADLTVALGDESMDAGEFARVVEAALSQLTLGLVPPGLDQVLVGAIERSRHPPIKAAFVLGMADRSFPRAAAVRAILTDEDRQDLAGRDVAGEPVRPNRSASRPDPLPAVELAPGRGELLFDEDLMAYLALTRPAERLWVSWPAADEAGKPVNPSRYVALIRRRWPDLQLVRLVEQPPAAMAVTAGELSGWLAGQYAASARTARPEPLEMSFDRWLRDRAADAYVRMTASLDYANRPALSAQTADRLFAPRGRLGGSVTRLESFAACPFKHLARFGLGLRQRERIELDALQLGRLYHELLRQLFERLGPGPVDWSARPVDQLRRLVGELVASARRELAVPALSGGAATWLLGQVEQVLGELVEAFRAAALAGPTVRQVAAELRFGLRDDSDLPPLRAELPGKDRWLSVSGKIDRLDLARDGSLFVIDFKSGASRINWTQLYHGLALQLPAYLLAVDQHREELAKRLVLTAPPRTGPRLRADQLRPAGAFFQRIAAPPESQPPPPLGAELPDERARWAPYQRAGLLTGEAVPMLDAPLAPGQASPFVRVKLNKDGSVSAQSADVVSGELMDALLQFVAGWMVKLGSEILSGRADVAPYRLGNASPCPRCEFRAVCRLDFAYNQPRHLAGIRRTDVLDKLGG